MTVQLFPIAPQKLPELPIGKKIVDASAGTIANVEKLEKVVKLVKAALDPFTTLGYLPNLPKAAANISKMASQFTDVTGGLKLFPRLKDWVFYKKRTFLDFMQLSAMTGAHILGTVKFISKVAMFALPAACILATNSLLLTNFSILSWKDSKQLVKIHKQMKKALFKKNKWSSVDDAKFDAVKEKSKKKIERYKEMMGKNISLTEFCDQKVKKWEERNDQKKVNFWKSERIRSEKKEEIPTFLKTYQEKYQKKLEKFQSYASAESKEKLCQLKQKKWESLNGKLKADRKDKRISLAFNILMVALMILSIVAIITALANPVFLSVLAAVALVSASLAVVKVYRKKG